MFILPVSDDVNQIFNFPSQYRTTVNLKFPDYEFIVGTESTYNPIMDIYIDGYETIYGIPLIPYVDLVSDFVSAGCIPVDYGAIICFPSPDGDLLLESFVSGAAALVYLEGPEVAALSLSLVFE